MDDRSSENDNETEFEQYKYGQHDQRREQVLGFEARESVSARRDLRRALAVVDLTPVAAIREERQGRGADDEDR